MCLKDNCQGFQKTPLEIMPGVSLPIFFMPKLKSFGVAPTSPTECRASSHVSCRVLVYDRLLSLFSSYVDGVGELSPPSVFQGDICSVYL